MTVPRQPKIYHIVHVDRLSAVVQSGELLCDAEVSQRALSGTAIGMSQIKQRRLTELTLKDHPDLHVGDCVPFYFCPRSVMLYLISCRNHPDLEYRGGQEPIVHLQADFFASIDWANQTQRRWAFTVSNAGSYFFESYSDLDRLGEINWAAVRSNDWRERSVKENKQAEFLIEKSFSWSLIERIGVCTKRVYQQVLNILPKGGHRPRVELKSDWYYEQ